MDDTVRILVKDKKVIAGKENLIYLLTSEDGEFGVMKKKWSPMKTYKQIKTWKGVILPAYCNHTGETKQDAERQLLKDYGECEIFQKGDEHFVFMKDVEVYTKDEMSNFIQGVLDHCEYDLGFVIDIKKRKNYKTGHKK